MRILIAGILGGIVMFIWGAVSHMLLPIGEMGMKTATNQDATIAAVQAAASPGAGVYMLPGMDPADWRDQAKYDAFVSKYQNSPYAFVVYRPEGNPALSSMAPNLVKQFASDTLAAIVLAWVLALGVFAFSKRVTIAAAAGLFSWLSISVPYWNWYLFPADFTLASLIGQIVGWVLAGAAIAWWLGRGEKRA